MRRANNEDAFTPLGLWIKEYLPASFSVTNLDYVIEEYQQERFMLVEEKQDAGTLHRGQRLTFAILDEFLHKRCQDSEYEYWGFYLVQFPAGCSFVGPGVKLNKQEVKVEELKRHLSFDEKVVSPYQFEWRQETLFRGDGAPATDDDTPF